MRHQHFTNHFLFDAGISFRQFALSIRFDPATPVLSCKRSIFILEPPLYAVTLKNWAIGDRHEFHVIIGDSEEECSQTWITSLVNRRLHYSVNSWTVVPSGKEFHWVTRVDDLKRRVSLGACRKPFTTWQQRTRALSICRIHLHLPSGDITWRAETGWDQRIVMEPKSRDRSHVIVMLSKGIVWCTCVTFQPDVIRFCFLILGSGVAVSGWVYVTCRKWEDTYYFINRTRVVQAWSDSKWERLYETYPSFLRELRTCACWQSYPQVVQGQSQEVCFISFRYRHQNR